MCIWLKIHISCLEKKMHAVWSVFISLRIYKMEPPEGLSLRLLINGSLAFICVFLRSLQPDMKDDDGIKISLSKH